MANLAFELGFDWYVHPILGVRDGVFPLQMFLVNDDSGTVISSCDPSQVQTQDVLSFRVYDFTAWPAGVPPVASPDTLQVLFTSATTVAGETQPHFSPVKLPNGNQVAQMAATSPMLVTAPPSTSIAFTSAVAGWTVQWSTTNPAPEDVTLEQSGRFNFRALLTVSPPDEMAKFYRADPEMVIGDPATVAG